MLLRDTQLRFVRGARLPFRAVEPNQPARDAPEQQDRQGDERRFRRRPRRHTARSRDWIDWIDHRIHDPIVVTDRICHVRNCPSGSAVCPMIVRVLQQSEHEDGDERRDGRRKRQADGRMAPPKKRPSSAWPAGFGALAITVSPPPVTAPCTTASFDPSSSDGTSVAR